MNQNAVNTIHGRQINGISYNSYKKYKKFPFVLNSKVSIGRKSMIIILEFLVKFYISQNWSKFQVINS